jgi:hypothetical protein
LQEERLMAYFNRVENITIFSEREIPLEDPKWFGVTVLLRVPPAANQDQLNRMLIQHAIVEKCGVLASVDNIIKHEPDYLVWASSTDQATRILRTPEIDIEGCKIIVYPWTPYHGTLIVPFDGTPPPTPSQTPAKRARSPEIWEHLKVTVLGLPPHLCQPITIPRIYVHITI